MSAMCEAYFFRLGRPIVGVVAPDVVGMLAEEIDVDDFDASRILSVSASSSPSNNKEIPRETDVGVNI